MILSFVNTFCEGGTLRLEAERNPGRSREESSNMDSVIVVSLFLALMQKKYQSAYPQQ